MWVVIAAATMLIGVVLAVEANERSSKHARRQRVVSTQELSRIWRYEAFEENAYRNLARVILFIAGGGLATSFGIVGLGSEIARQNRNLLVLVWVLLGLSLFLVAVTTYLATFTWRLAIDTVQDPADLYTAKRLTTLITVIGIGNLVAVLATAVGLVAFGVFLFRELGT